MQQGLVSIITVNYNTPLETEAMLASIATTNTYPDVEIIVVDNASPTNHVPEWRERYSEVTFIRLDQNLGFAGGNNRGIQIARGEFLFFVNSDTLFTPQLTESLVQLLADNHHIGMVSPMIYYHEAPFCIQYAGYTEMNFLTGRNRCIGQFETDRGQYAGAAFKTGYAHGAAMMIRREVINKVGMMPEHFFLYYEELDWCEKIKHAGYEVWVEPRAAILHKESVSVGKATALKEYYLNRNRILFERRNAPRTAYLVFLFYLFIGIIPRNILSYIQRRQYAFIPVLLKAVWWNLINNKEGQQLLFPANRST